ncbi:fimbria/pilus outer membrane usher protein [Pseudomonas sp. SDO55104_S430]
MIAFKGRRRVPARQRFAQLFLIGSGSAALVEAGPALAGAPLSFQSGFMHQGSRQPADAGHLALQALAETQALGPGRYQVEVRVNHEYRGRHEFDFVPDESGELAPCFSAAQLEAFGVKLDALANPEQLGADCLQLSTLIEGARSEFDGGALQLALSIPQIAMRRDVAGYVDPERWDEGINAAFLNYQVSAQQGSNRNGSNNSQDLFLNAGVNLGPWRLRTNQSGRQDSHGEREWTRAYTYAQRDLPGMNANLTLGEAFTGGDVFKSVPIKGALVSSDAGMLPDSMQGYAPVIRGVALSRSRLEVRQNGYPIYSTYVSAGPYEIDDLNTGGGAGELEIILTEADGQVRRFTQPYASLGNLLREGSWRYSAAVGRYNSASHIDDPLMWQGTLAMGSAFGSTFYGGLLASEHYQAMNVGIAKDLGSIGALALDITRSDADLDTRELDSVQGTSYAIKYGKTFPTRTSLRFAGYRYSTEGYRDFDEAVRQRSQDASFRGSRRSRLEAAVYQNLTPQSSLTLSLSQEDFWRSNYQRRQFQFNFNTQHKGVGYTLFASQSLSDREQHSDRQFGLSVTLPLGFGHTNSATFDVQKNGNTHSQRASLNGSLDDNRFNYRAAVANQDNRQQSAELSMGYQTQYGNVGAGVSQGNDYRNLSMNATGAVLLHGDGIELGPYLGETAGLVEVPGIKDVGIANAPGVRTNERGYALVPYLRPYRVNHVELDTDQLGPDVEIDNGTAQAVPRRGAVVKTTFAARSVNRMVINATFNGQPLPFGAQVRDRENAVIGVVGQAGQLMLSVDDQPQSLEVRWAGQQCQLDIDPQHSELTEGYRMQDLICR